jgi:SAM-dependent methyltransferase
MSFVSAKGGQFEYFDSQLGHPRWAGRRVLDFGGNAGNILESPKAGIDIDRYWCIDVSRDAIERGRSRHPGAHWILYDRYNFEFNPAGVAGLEIPDPGERFDYILSYSVFTHTSRAEMTGLVRQLMRLLAPGGSLAFTFIDPQWVGPAGSSYPCCNLKWRLQKRKEVNPSVDVEGLHKKGRGANWCTLVNDEDLYLDDEIEPDYPQAEKKAYITLCRAAYMTALFPGAEVVSPASPERQHCCILRA